MATSVSNMRRFRSGSIGSMRAWLPSRRSTEHQRGALTSFLSGQVRSGSSSGMKGRYLAKAIFLGVTGRGGMFTPRQARVVPENKKPPGDTVAGGSASARLRSPLHKKEAQERVHCGPRLPAKPRLVNPFLTGRPTRHGGGKSRRVRGSAWPAAVIPPGEERHEEGGEGRRLVKPAVSTLGPRAGRPRAS